VSRVTNFTPLFSRRSDEWTTPSDLWQALHEEFGFTLDAAATPANTRCVKFLVDALTVSWGSEVVWLNPPYSEARAFMAKARKEAKAGATVVCLVPARTDTQWFHKSVWDRFTNAPYPNVEIRFLKGRLKFGNGTGSAPFPSMLVIFRPSAIRKSVVFSAPA
jgi:phage N-6-adenine-methyltransferase